MNLSNTLSPQHLFWRGSRLLMALVMIVGMLNVASPAYAASVVVTTTADTIDAAAGNCASVTLASLPGSDGQTSLREAVCAANGTAGADTITLPAGTYTLTRTGQNEDNAATGDLDIEESLTINGTGAASTIIDGNNTDAVFDTYNAPSGTTINMSGLTIQHGNPTGSSFEGGGGIYVKNTVTMSLANVNVLNNTANTSGGGIWNEGNLIISNSTISGNQANGEGGGIRNAGTPAASLTIANSTISYNIAEFGGGIHDSTDGGINLTISGSTISGNQAVDRLGGPAGDFGDGGGVHVNTDGGVSITKSTLSGNAAARNGGGIYFADDPAGGSPVASLAMSYNRIVGNTAVVGSGLFRSSGTATTEKNWWGCNSGPSAGPCNTVSGTVDFTPWIVLTHTANPGTISTGEASTLTADFLKNSDGSANAAGDLGALVGVPITFSNAVLGTVSGAQAAIQSSGKATATYTAGNTPGAGSAAASVDSASATANITISAPPDSTPPNTTITTAPSNPSNNSSPSFSFSGTDDQTPSVSLAFQCQLDGGGFAACTNPQSYSGLSDGSHTFQVRAVDAANNADPTPASYTWTIETVPPDTTLDSFPANPSNSSSASFSFSGTDGGSGVASFECKLDGGSFGACTSPQSYSNLSDGSHTFQVRAIDGAGNVDPTSASYTWTIDATGPDTLIVTHPQVNSNSSSADFSFTGNDGSGTGVAGFECKLDGGSFSACTSPQSYTGLADGNHTFQVRAIDNVGNVDASPDVFGWTIDTTPPDTTIDSSPSNPSNSTTATFSFSGTDHGGTGVIGFACQIDGGGFTACSSPQTYLNLGDGSHTFQVRAVDVLTNIDPTPASYTWTIDTTAPGVTINQANGQADPAIASPIHFTAVFNEAVTGFTGVDVSLGGTAGATTAAVTEIAPNNGTTYDVAVSGMTTNGTVITGIAANVATDAAGNGNAASTSTDNTVTFIFDNTPPDTTIDSSPSNPTGSTSASFTFSGTDNPGGTGVASFECKLDSGSFAACTSPKTYSSLSLGSHTFQLRAIDGIGNIDPTPASFTWEIHAATSLLYTGAQIVNVGNSFQPAAKLSSSASACVSGQTVSFTLDRNPLTGAAGAYSLGTATTNSSGQATMSPAVSTTGWQEGIYDLHAIFAGTSSCDPSSDEATLTVASPGNSATGGGWYTLSGSGRVNFGFTVRKTDNKCTSNCAYKGQVLLVNNGKWRLKGTLTAYSKLSTGQGAASGTGDLYWWDSSLNGGLGDWTLAQSGVSFTINFFDSGKNGKSSTDAFGIKIQHMPVSPQPNTLPNSSPTQLKGGDIKVQ